MASQVRDAESRDLARRHISDLIILEREQNGDPLDVTDPYAMKQLAKQADRMVADWHTTADIDDWVDGITRQHVPARESEVATTPTSRLVTEYRLAQIKRKIFDHRAVQPSDRHDAEHAAAGAYYDILVTNDTELRETLGDIVSLPYRFTEPDTFAKELEQLVIGELANAPDLAASR